MRKYPKFLITLFLFFFSITTLAATAEQELNSLLSNFHSMSANFTQKTFTKNGAAKASNGNMALQRPGKFRWEIFQPNHQIIIADGQYLWVYDVELEQAIRKNLNQDANSPAILLSGSTSAIADRFAIQNLDQQGNSKIFHLMPKVNQDMFQRVDIQFQNGKLSQMAVIDNLGQKNVFYFSNVVTNPSLNASLFRFQPQSKVDVVKE